MQGNNLLLVYNAAYFSSGNWCSEIIHAIMLYENRTLITESARLIMDLFFYSSKVLWVVIVAMRENATFVLLKFL